MVDLPLTSMVLQLGLTVSNQVLFVQAHFYIQEAFTTNLIKLNAQITHCSSGKLCHKKGFDNTSLYFCWLRYLLNLRHLCTFASSLFLKFILFSEVPQGPFLGPYISPLSINDLPKSFEKTPLILADGVKIFATITKVKDCLRDSKKFGRSQF